MSDQPLKNAKSRKDAEAQLIAKAWRDKAFAQDLRTNPKAAIQKELGVKQIPDTVEIKVLEETPDTLYLVIPEKPASAPLELSDEDLAQAAGGMAKLYTTTRGFMDYTCDCG